MEKAGRSHATLPRRLLHRGFDDVTDRVPTGCQVEQMIGLIKPVPDGPFQDPPLILGHAFHRRVDGGRFEVGIVHGVQYPHLAQVPGVVTHGDTVSVQLWLASSDRRAISSSLV